MIATDRPAPPLVSAPRVRWGAVVWLALAVRRAARGEGAGAPSSDASPAEGD